MEEGFLIIEDGAGDGFLYGFLAGIDYFGFGGMHLAKWLAGMAFLLFGAGLLLEGKRNIMLFEMVRFGSRKRWWNARFRHLFLTGTAGCSLYAFCMMGLDGLFGKEKPDSMEMIWILLLWMVHMMVIISVFCVLDLTVMRPAAPALLFVTEVSSFILGFFIRDLSKYMFGCWGMYMQSMKEEEVFGFSPAAVLTLECLMILTAWRTGMKIASGDTGEFSLRRRGYYGKTFH